MIGASVTADTELAVRCLSQTLSTSSGASATILSVASIVELRIDEMLIEATNKSKAKADPLTHFLLSKHARDISRTWSDRQHALSSAFGIDLRIDDVGSRFNAVIFARNALAHGSGSLTDQQLRKQVTFMLAKERDLKRYLDIYLKGTSMVLGRETARLSYCAGRDYLLTVDLGLKDLLRA